MKNSLTHTLILFLTVTFLTAVSGAYAYEIGSGYSCDGTSIKKNGKVVKLSVVKASIQAKINDLGNNPRNKTKKDALKQLKSQLIDCSKGVVPVDAVGTYTGSLVRMTSSGTSTLCDDRNPISGTFIIESNGGINLKAPDANHPINVNFFGRSTGTGFTLTGAEGVLFRSFWTLTATSVTESSAVFDLKLEGKKPDIRGNYRPVCGYTWQGTMVRQ